MTQFLCFLVPPAIALLLTLRDKNCRSSPVFLLGRWICYALGIYITVAVLRTMTGSNGIRWGLTMGGRAFLYVNYGVSAAAAACTMGVLLGLITPPLKKKLGLEETIIKKHEGVKGSRLNRFFVHAFMFMMLMLTFAYAWGTSTFGHINFEQILFHIRMPLRGTGGSILDTLSNCVWEPTAAAFILFELLCRWPGRKAYQLRRAKDEQVLIQILPLRLPSMVTALVFLFLWLAGLAYYANDSFGFVRYIQNQLNQSVLFEKDYADPRTVSMEFPQKKRNLITVYLESCETSVQDVAHGGIFQGRNYIPELTQLAQENVSFSHSDQFEGAAVAPACSWTMAGLFAQTAGLPLKLHSFEDEMNNQMGIFKYFMPGAVSLGDILAANGYRNVFMAGSDFTFGGRKLYYTQHGGYEILDHPLAIEQGRIPQDYYVNWGFEDLILYDWAKEELTKLSMSDEPFNFSMLTVDQHSPGYVCPLCPDLYDEAYGNVLACSSKQLYDFVRWCQEQPFYENTSIVVTGDHDSMVATFFENKEIVDEERKNKVYNVFINSAVQPAQEKNRLFTTMDMFPTVLSSIGVKIEGERLALGTNLFSSEETLAEKYGYAYLFEEINKKSDFFNENILYP